MCELEHKPISLYKITLKHVNLIIKKKKIPDPKTCRFSNDTKPDFSKIKRIIVKLNKLISSVFF